MAKTYLVVGGCGFLGRYIVEELLKYKPQSVVKVFDLRINKFSDKVEYVQGDLTKQDDVDRACQGVNIVIHTASPTHGLGRQLYEKVNVHGTRNLISSCKKQGVKVLVFTSSASVVFDGSDLKGVDETAPYCKKHLDPYTETKMIAEQEVLAANGNGLATCALRPSGIFGPRDVQAWPGFIDAAKAGKSKYQMGDGKNLMDWSYVENVAMAHWVAADELEKGQSKAAGQAFFITNGEPIPFWDMAKYCWKNMGYPLPTIQVPTGLILLIAIIIDFIVMLLSPLVVLHPTITYFRIVNATAYRYFSIEKARKLLGYTPRVSLKEGMERTLEYFKKNS